MPNLHEGSSSVPGDTARKWSGATRRGLLALLPGALAACAVQPPVEEMRGTPLALAAVDGFATVHGGGEGGPGSVLGSAVAIGEGLVACSAHILPEGAGMAWLRRSDGRGVGAARVIARSPIMDLVLLRETGSLLSPVRRVETAPRVGEPVWAAGSPNLGPTVAAGRVEIADAILPGFGRGFTARLPALMGYSGGPVVDGRGQLCGLVTAVPDGGGTAALALLSGLDLAGLAGRASRRVFVLSAEQVMAEAGRLGVVAA